VSGRHPWVLLLALIALLGVVAAVTSTRPVGASPGHESSSDALDGTSALRLYAERLGYRTAALEGEFQLPAAPSLLFVFTPLPPNGYSASQAAQLRSWVSAGGVLVYAAESGDPQLDRALSLGRRPNLVDAAAGVPAPILGGLRRVQGSAQAQPFAGRQRQVPLLRNSKGDILGLTLAVGNGRVVALADPLALCNGYLGQADNGRLAADLLAMAPGGGSVLFDEYHHGAAAATGPSTAWTATSWGAAILWIALVLVVGLALRGRAFGPRVPLSPGGDRSSAEYATAVGALLRRARARSVTLQTLDSASRRLCGERLGLSGEAGASTFLDTLGRRAPSLAGELAEVEAGLPTASRSDAALLEVAHRLHQLAFPTVQVRERRAA
jgi:uncharacterized protein DUF4350